MAGLPCLATAVQLTEADHGLLGCLQLARVDAGIIDNFSNVLKLETLEDFLFYVREGKADEDLVAMVDSVNGFKDSRLQQARVKAAWNMGRDALKASQDAMKAGASAQDLEDPLPEQSMQAVEAAWQKAYNIQIEVHLQPSDSLLGRIYREFRRHTATVLEAKKMRSVLVDKNPLTKKAAQLPAGLRVEFEQVEDVTVASTIEYYFCLRTLAYAWALAGIYMVDSKDTPGTKTIMMALSDALDYADMALRLASTTGQNNRAWLEERDLLCRGKMVTYIRRGWSAGEALKKAISECYIEWHTRGHALETTPFRENGAKKRAMKAADGQDEASSPVKKPRTVSTLPGGQQICKPWVDGRGCTNKKCPSAHVCDVVKADGKACGQKHTRAAHRE